MKLELKTLAPYRALKSQEEDATPLKVIQVSTEYIELVFAEHPNPEPKIKVLFVDVCSSAGTYTARIKAKWS